MYKLTLDDKNVIIIENVDYNKLYSLYNEFMYLKSQKAILQIHRFILSNIDLSRGSNAMLIPKTATDDIVRESVRTTLAPAPQLPCTSCGRVLRVGIKRLHCNNCFADYCKSCSDERWADTYWCRNCNNHTIYRKWGRPTDDLRLKRLHDVIAK